MSSVHGLIRMMAGGTRILGVVVVVIHPHGRAGSVLLILKNNLRDSLDCLAAALMNTLLGKGCSFLSILHALEVKELGHQSPTRFKRANLLRFLGHGDIGLWLLLLLGVHAHHYEARLILWLLYYL
jgi:hypothetical protein